MTVPPLVLGIDVSLTATGLASSLGECAVHGIPKVTTLALADRIAAVDKLTLRVIDAAHALMGPPALVVMEYPSVVRAAGGVVERAALWWQIAHAWTGTRVPVLAVTPGQLKQYATGKGGASKEAVVEAVTRRYPRYETHGDNNACDAIVLAAIGCDLLGHPIVDVPATHRRALAKLVVPMGP